ncbi:MAG: hypothetical protein ACKVU1_01310 [bacterium]
MCAEQPGQRPPGETEIERLRDELRALRDEHEAAARVLAEAMALTKSTTHRAFVHDLRNILNDVAIMREVIRMRQTPPSAT